MFNEQNDLSNYLIEKNKYSELFLEFILNAQSIVDSKSTNKSNILIYSDSIDKTNYFLIYLLKQKYNLNINQIIKLFNLKNIKINQKIIDLLF
jgi:Fic family protein